MYFIQKYLVYCIIVVMFKCILAQGYIPEYLHVCHRSDPEINSCIVKSVETLRPKLRVGIPELNVPPMEPLPLETISLQRGPQGASVNLNLTKIRVWGPSTFEITYVNHNIEKNLFEFKAVVPNIYFKGRYSINMNIILLKVNGRGNIIGNFSNFVIDAKMQGREVFNASTESHHLYFNKIHMNLSIGKSTMKFEGLFAQDPLLSRVAGEIIEDNSAALVEEIRPALESSLGKVFTKIANGITGSFTYDELFPL